MTTSSAVICGILCGSVPHPHLRIDPELRILFTTAKGTISLDDVQKHLDQESEEKALAYRELVDALSARNGLTSDQVRVLVHRLYGMVQQQQFGPTAVVTGNDELFGMASMLSILSEIKGGPFIGVFRGFSEALNWLLQLPPPR